MNFEQHNFERLRRMLVLKKYEQPPPRYFHEFSGRVIARIEAGESGADPVSSFGWLLEPATWVQRFWESIESRPLIAGACGFAFCGFLAAGMLFADKAPAGSVMAVSSPFEVSFETPGMPVNYVNTNGLFPAPGSSPSLFEEFRRPNAHPQAQLLIYNP